MHRVPPVDFEPRHGIDEQKGGAQGKAIVQGLLDRTARQMRAQVVPNVTRETLQNEVINNVRYGTKVYTDDAVAYEQTALALRA